MSNIENIYESDNTNIKSSLYNTVEKSTHDLITEVVKLDTVLKSIHPSKEPNIWGEDLPDKNIINYQKNFNHRLSYLELIDDEIATAPKIDELIQEETSKINNVKKENKDINENITKLKEEIEQIENDTSDKQSNVANLLLKSNINNAKINTAKKNKKDLQQEQFYKQHIHEKHLVKKEDIHRMDLNNDDTYNKIAYNIMDYDIQDSTSQKKQNLQNKINKIARQSDDVKYNFERTDKLKRADKAVKALENLQKNLNKNNQPASNLEPFSNIVEYKIQYSSPDYKQIMLSDASCNELDAGFNESLNCNDSNYNDNITNCMQRAWCEYQELSNTLHDNQTNLSQDKERYQDANQYYNLAVVDSINLSIGIFGVVFLILKNRNII